MAQRAKLDRTAVVAAAAWLADKEGYEKLSLVTLAAELGIRSQSLYAHIDGLGGLRRDLQLLYHRLIADRARRAGIGVAGRDAVLAIASAHLAVADEHPGLLPTAAIPPAANDDEMWAAIAEAGEPLNTVLRSYGLDAEQVTHWHRIIWASVYGFATLRHARAMTLPGDTAVSFGLMIGAFADELEQLRR